MKHSTFTGACLGLASCIALSEATAGSDDWKYDTSGHPGEIISRGSASLKTFDSRAVCAKSSASAGLDSRFQDWKRSNSGPLDSEKIGFSIIVR